MYKFLLFIFVLFSSMPVVIAQDEFNYIIDLEPVEIPGLPGLHSYAFAQHDGKWVVFGGRKDGLHARQPFNAFPQSWNNSEIFVIDVETKEFWAATVDNLPTSLREQLQSTNMNFHQDGDVLYIIGGYAFSPTIGDHITFPYLTGVQVPELIDAIVNGENIAPFFKQISDPVFAVTGGHLKKLDDTFYLVGGHRFDGRYNPMGPNHGPGFTQVYTNQIRKFTIENTGPTLNIANYATITDPIHLRRRDYNLLPQIFPDGQHGFTISAGVFQIGADLPFLYPVDISASGFTPVTDFNQYLSHYHSAVASLYDSTANAMHSIFFGGMSQYYYENGSIVRDDQVPFVKTISRLTRNKEGNLTEVQESAEMPGLKGASAEFILNENLAHYESEIIKLDQVTEDTTLLGHIYGGILSTTLNPFSTNQTSNTSADNAIYEVRLIRNDVTSIKPVVNGKNPYDIDIFPNPAEEMITVNFDLKEKTRIRYYVTNTIGQIIIQGDVQNTVQGKNELVLSFNNITNQTLMLTFVFDDEYFVTKRVVLK